MTTQKKVYFLQLSQEIAALNTKVLEAANGLDEAETETADEVLQASSKLIQAQNNLLKAVNK